MLKPKTFFDLTKQTSGGGGEGGVTDHNDLTGRTRANQHPISSINGLQDVLNNKMERYVIKLVKNGENFSIQTYAGVNLDFSTLSIAVKNVGNYVVMLYGNSKLRPQYVSTNEMMFVGLDRSQNTKVLRVVFTPTRCSYETFEIMETSDYQTEEWQFVLEDGSTVTKQIVLGA